jgi:hypothetical protein
LEGVFIDLSNSLSSRKLPFWKCPFIFFQLITSHFKQLFYLKSFWNTFKIYRIRGYFITVGFVLSEHVLAERTTAIEKFVEDE